MAEISRARDVLPFQPRVQISEGIAQTLAWCKLAEASTGAKVGYGMSPFGAIPFGGYRKVSDGKMQVPRQVSPAGQLSYRGRLYTLGAQYRGRQAWILEFGNRLVVSIEGVPPLELSKRR